MLSEPIPHAWTEVIEQEPVTPPTTPLSPGNVGVGVVKGRGSRTKRRGLAAVGEEATRDFYKAATSMSAGKSGQQVTFEEQFFAHSFRCLDFGQFEEEFQEFLADDIVEKSHKYALEKAGGRRCLSGANCCWVCLERCRQLAHLN